ncbi:MAG: efflux RND transporter permease subunit [Pirellulales bacterium]
MFKGEIWRSAAKVVEVEFWRLLRNIYNGWINSYTNTVKPSSKMILQRFFATVIRLRWLVYLFAVVWFVFGINALRQLPIDALPNLSENQVLIYVRYPDKSPLKSTLLLRNHFLKALARLTG